MYYWASHGFWVNTLYMLSLPCTLTGKVDNNYESKYVNNNVTVLISIDRLHTYVFVSPAIDNSPDLVF